MSSSNPNWKSLPWDTGFFGVKTARLYGSQLQNPAFTQALDECRADGIEVVHYLAESNDDVSIGVVEQAGFHLVDIRMTLEWHAASAAISNVTGNSSLRSHLPEDIPVLQDMARHNYYDSRFYCDRRYPRDRVDALYAEWIARSCRESGYVLVAVRGGDIAGYVTCDLDSEHGGQIGLLGVDGSVRRSGIAGLLVRGAQRWFVEHGAHTVRVVTQARNVGAMRVYQRCGFVSSYVQLWYHRWLD